MRLWLLLAVSFFCCLSFSFAKDQNQSRPAAQGRRRRGKKTARQGKVPVHSEHNGGSVFIDSYKNVQEPKPNYNVIPGNTGQCAFQGITMYDKTVWSPKPCVTCLCSSGNVVCDEMQCPVLQCQIKFKPIGQCCPICIEPVLSMTEVSGDSPVPNDLSATESENPPVEDEVLRREKYKEEEERLLKKDAERKKRKKQKEAEKQRKQQEMQAQEREQEPKRFFDDMREMREKEEDERRSEDERVRSMEIEQMEMLRSLEEVTEDTRNEVGEDRVTEEDEEPEENVWLRGDVFEMPTQLPMPPPTAPYVSIHTGERIWVEEEEEEEAVRISHSLPPGCTVSDVILSCENAKLTNMPSLSIPELKSLSLQGNLITSIPAEAFNGIPNLEWIDLGKNRITSNQIHPQAFKKLKFLARLYMDGNLLEHIPPGLPNTLQELKLNENNLQYIDTRSFDGLSNLVILEMEGNLLSEENVHHNVFRPLKQLTYLRLGRNFFRTIPESLPASLLELHLENNMIEQISDGVFNQSKNLNVVVLRHNKLEETKISPMAWIDHTNLESIDLSHNNLHLVPSFLPKSLVHLVLVANQIERIPGYVFAHMEPGLEYLYLSYNRLDEDGVEPESFLGTINTMTELCLDHNQLTIVPYGINEMTSLHFLRLNNNNIRHFGEDSICDPTYEEDSHIVALRLENNLLDLRKIPPTSFSCVRSYSSVVIKPQRVK